LLLTAVAVTSVGAQDHSECEQVRADADESIARSKDNFRDKSNFEARARVQILKMYEVCKDESLEGQYGPTLVDIEERMGEHEFTLAKYYYNQYRAGKGGLKGAESRLRIILEKYVEYSKSDEVLFLLGRTYVFEHRQEDGTATFTDLIRKYPASPLAYKAQTYIDRLAAKPSQ
jgi:hypothetical protein